MILCGAGTVDVLEEKTVGHSPVGRTYRRALIIASISLLRWITAPLGRITATIADRNEGSFEMLAERHEQDSVYGVYSVQQSSYYRRNVAKSQDRSLGDAAWQRKISYAGPKGKKGNNYSARCNEREGGIHTFVAGTRGLGLDHSSPGLPLIAYIWGETRSGVARRADEEAKHRVDAVLGDGNYY